AARSPEAAELALHHHHSESGTGPEEVVGGPQAGVSAADDHDIGLFGSDQGRTRLGRRALVVPEAEWLPVGAERGHPASTSSRLSAKASTARSASSVVWAAHRNQGSRASGHGMTPLGIIFMTTAS